MKKLLLTIELEYDDDMMHGEDARAIAWFYDDVLRDEDGLLLHSNEIGEEVGAVRVLSIEEVP